MAHNDERAAIELDEHQLKKNPLWNHVVLLEKASSGGNAMLYGNASIARLSIGEVTRE